MTNYCCCCCRANTSEWEATDFFKSAGEIASVTDRDWEATWVPLGWKRPFPTTGIVEKPGLFVSKMQRFTFCGDKVPRLIIITYGREIGNDSDTYTWSGLSLYRQYRQNRQWRHAMKQPPDRHGSAGHSIALASDTWSLWERDHLCYISFDCPGSYSEPLLYQVCFACVWCLGINMDVAVFCFQHVGH